MLLADRVVQLLQLQQIDIVLGVAAQQHTGWSDCCWIGLARHHISMQFRVRIRPSYLYVTFGKDRYLRGAAGARTALHATASDLLPLVTVSK